MKTLIYLSKSYVVGEDNYPYYLPNIEGLKVGDVRAYARGYHGHDDGYKFYVGLDVNEELFDKVKANIEGSEHTKIL